MSAAARSGAAEAKHSEDNAHGEILKGYGRAITVSLASLERTGSVICPTPTAQQPQPAMVRRNVSSTDTQNIMDILEGLENIGELLHCIQSCTFTGHDPEKGLVSHYRLPQGTGEYS